MKKLFFVVPAFFVTVCAHGADGATPSPEVINLPDTPEKSAFFDTFSLKERERRDELFMKKLESLKDMSLPIHFSEIPFIQLDSFPKQIKNFFENLTIYLPTISFNANGDFAVTGTVTLYGKSVSARIFVGKDKKGKSFYSIAVHMPDGWKFSDTFPRTALFDPSLIEFFKYKKAWFLLSTAEYKDDFFDVELKPGLNFFGDILPSGTVFKKLDVLFKNKLSKLPSLKISGVLGLNPSLIGSVLQIDVPIGITFSKRVKTTPLSLLVFVEEKLAKIPSFALGIKGGLEVLFKNQKNPVVFSLLGKYIMPDDLEFFAKLDGKLSDLLVKETSLEDLRLGFKTDIGLLVETSGIVGWVSGLSAKGTLSVGKSSVLFGAKGELSSETIIGDLTFIFEGSFYLKDLVRFWLARTQELTKKNIAIDALVRNVPNIYLEDIAATFVPRKTLDEGKKIEVGVGKVHLFNKYGKGSLYIADDALRGSLLLPEIIIGKKENPLFFLTGAGLDAQRGFTINVDLSIAKQAIYGDVLWGTSLFGGISRRARTDISALGFDVTSEFKWNNVVDSKLFINGSLTEDFLDTENLIAKVVVTQNGLDYVSDYLKKQAEVLLVNIQYELDRIKEGALKKLKEKVEKGDTSTIERIYQLEHSINRKINMCNQTFSKGITKILRPGCYAVMDVAGDLLKLLHMQFRKNVTLNVIMVGGRVGIEVVDATAKVGTRSVKDVLKFLSTLTKNSINVRRFELEASFKQLQDKRPLIIRHFDARLLGKTVEIKNLSFDLQKMKEFILAIFDSQQKKSVF